LSIEGRKKEIVFLEGVSADDAGRWLTYVMQNRNVKVFRVKQLEETAPSRGNASVESSPVAGRAWRPARDVFPSLPLAPPQRQDRVDTPPKQARVEVPGPKSELGRVFCPNCDECTPYCYEEFEYTTREIHEHYNSNFQRIGHTEVPVTRTGTRRACTRCEMAYSFPNARTREEYQQALTTRWAIFLILVVVFIIVCWRGCSSLPKQPSPKPQAVPESRKTSAPRPRKKNKPRQARRHVQTKRNPEPTLDPAVRRMRALEDQIQAAVGAKDQAASSGDVGKLHEAETAYRKLVGTYIERYGQSRWEVFKARMQSGVGWLSQPRPTPRGGEDRSDPSKWLVPGVPKREDMDGSAESERGWR